MKKILLINPPESGIGGRTSPPLGLLYLAAMFPEKDYALEIYDGVILGWEKLLQKINDYKPAIVGITCFTPSRAQVIKLVKIIKERDKSIYIVVGGIHPTIMGEQLLANCPAIDFLVCGEGEYTFKNLCNTLLSGQLDNLPNIDGIAYRHDKNIIFNKKRLPTKNLDLIPFPRWDLINIDDYSKILFPVKKIKINTSGGKIFYVIFSRGCVGQCSFCSVWSFWGGYYHRRPENMMAELQYLYNTYNARNIIFGDDCFTADKEAIAKLCDLIIKNNLKIIFKCSTRTDLLDEELIAKLKKAGCYEIAFGVESGDASILKSLDKKNTLDNTAKTFALLKKYGILSTAMMIIGNIGENYKTINNTIRFLKKIKPDVVASDRGLQILPGTKSYYYCKNKGYMTDDFWLSDKPYKLFDFEFSPNLLEVFEFAVKKQIYLTPWEYFNYIYIFSLRFILRKWRGLMIKIG